MHFSATIIMQKFSVWKTQASYCPAHIKTAFGQKKSTSNTYLVEGFAYVSLRPAPYVIKNIY